MELSVQQPEAAQVVVVVDHIVPPSFDDFLSTVQAVAVEVDPRQSLRQLIESQAIVFIDAFDDTVSGGLVARLADHLGSSGAMAHYSIQEFIRQQIQGDGPHRGAIFLFAGVIPSAGSISILNYAVSEEQDVLWSDGSFRACPMFAGPVGPDFDDGQRLTVDQVESMAVVARKMLAEHGAQLHLAEWVEEACVAVAYPALPLLAHHLALYEQHCPDASEAVALRVALRGACFTAQSELPKSDAPVCSVVAPGAVLGRLTERPRWRVQDRAHSYDLKHIGVRDGHGEKLVALIASSADTPAGFQALQAVIMRWALLADAVVVQFIRNPMLAFADGFRGRFQEDRDLAKALREVDPLGSTVVLRKWVEAMLDKVRDGRSVQAHVRSWSGAWNEREMREALRQTATELYPGAWAVLCEHDDLPEELVRREHFERLMKHPDLAVRAWRMPICLHWGDDRAIRWDPDLRPGPDGGFEERMFRLDPWAIFDGGDERTGYGCPPCPRMPAQAVRTCGIGLRRFRLATHASRQDEMMRHIQRRIPSELVRRETHRGSFDEGRGAITVQLQARNGLLLHMLTHSGEDPEDVARWVDDTYGITDVQVVVWNEEPVWSNEGTPAAAAWTETLTVAHLFGVDLLHAEQNPDGQLDLARARNVALRFGLELIKSKDPMASRLAWGAFVDPDEQLQDVPRATMAIRGMTLEPHRWGWLWRFLNPRPEGPPAASESTRMVLLGEGFLMDGRVHEGFDAARGKLIESGRDPLVGVAPFIVLNGTDQDRVTRLHKLRRYQAALVLEIQENPRNTKAWVALSLNALEAGDVDKEHEALVHAVETAGQTMLAHRAMARFYLRQARRSLELALARTQPGSSQFVELERLHGLIAPESPEPVVSIPEWTSEEVVVPVPPWAAGQEPSEE